MINLPVKISAFNLIPDVYALLGSENYDIAVGIHENTINDSLRGVYRQMYPRYLSGGRYIEEIEASLKWDLKEIPTLKFVKSQSELEEFFPEYRQANIGSKREALSSTYKDLLTEEEIELYSDTIRLLMASQVFSLIEFPMIDITISGRNIVGRINAGFKAKILCCLSKESDRKFTILPVRIIMDKVSGLAPEEAADRDIGLQGGSITYSYEDFLFFIANELVAPIIVEKAEDMIPAIELPPLEYMGIAIENVSVDTKEGFLIIAANSRKLMELNVADRLPALPQGGFFTLAGRKFMNTIGEVLLKSYGRKSGQGSVSIIDYAYDISLCDPEVKSINGEKISTAFNFKVNRFRAVVKVPYIDIGVSVDITAETTTKPCVTASVYFNPANEVMLKINSVSEFKIKFNFVHLPDILSRFGSWILDTLKDILMPELNSWISKLDTKILEIPKLSLPLVKNILVVNYVPQNLSVKEYDGMLSVSGDLRFSTDRLKGGEDLQPGEALVSQNGKYILRYEGEDPFKAELVLYNGQPKPENLVWRSFTQGEALTSAVMEKDGNFVIYDTKGQLAVWETVSYGHMDSTLILRDNGNLEIIDRDGKKIWETNTPEGRIYTDRISIYTNPVLLPGQYVRSAGDYKTKYLLYRPNGNLEAMDREFKKMWETDTMGFSKGNKAGKAFIDNEGALVLLTDSGKMVYRSNTAGGWSNEKVTCFVAENTPDNITMFHADYDGHEERKVGPYRADIIGVYKLIENTVKKG